MSTYSRPLFYTEERKAEERKAEERKAEERLYIKCLKININLL